MIGFVSLVVVQLNKSHFMSDGKTDRGGRLKNMAHFTFKVIFGFAPFSTHFQNSFSLVNFQIESNFHGKFN